MCNVLLPPAVNPISVNKYIIYVHYNVCYYGFNVTALFRLLYCIVQSTFISGIQLQCSSCWLSTCSHVRKEWTWLHLATIYMPSAFVLPYPPFVTCILPFILSTSFLNWCSWFFIGVNGGEVALQIGWVRRQPAWAHQPCSLFSWPRNNLLLWHL